MSGDDTIRPGGSPGESPQGRGGRPDDGPPDAPGALDRYLDGLMSPPERAVFERHLSRDPALRREVDLQRQIDDRLRVRFSPPERIAPPTHAHRAGADGLLAGSAPARDESQEVGSDAAGSKMDGAGVAGLVVRPRPRRWLGLAAAACVLLAGGAAGGYWWFVIGQSAPLRQPGDIWAMQVAASFTPEWVCTTDGEFARNVRERFGEEAVLPLATPGVEIVGWAYGTPVLSNKTATLITRVDGREVLVLIDRAESDVNMRRVGFSRGIAPVEGLHLYKRRLGGLVLYEVSPLERARVLPSFQHGA